MELGGKLRSQENLLAVLHTFKTGLDKTLMRMLMEIFKTHAVKLTWFSSHILCIERDLDK